MKPPTPLVITPANFEQIAGFWLANLAAHDAKAVLAICNEALALCQAVALDQQATPAERQPRRTVPCVIECA